MSSQILIAVPKIKIAKIHCKIFVFTFFPKCAPKGEAIKLAIIMIKAGINITCPVISLPVVAPIEEINVIAKDVAMVILVGIFKTRSIIGTKINAPAAPTIQIGRAHV